MLFIGAVATGIEDGQWTPFLIMCIPIVGAILIAMAAKADEKSKKDDSVSLEKNPTPKSVLESNKVVKNSHIEDGKDEKLGQDGDLADVLNGDDNNDDWDDDDDYDWGRDDQDDLYDYIDKTEYRLKITAKEFRYLRFAVKQLLKLCHIMSADSEMCHFVFSNLSNKDSKQGEFNKKQFYSFLKCLLAKDIIYIYEHLGYDVDIDLDYIEGQVLLAIIKTFSEDHEENHFKAFKKLIRHDDDYNSAMRDSYEDMLEVYKNQNGASISAKGVDDFSLVNIIKFARQEKRYLGEMRTGLYLLVSTIAETSVYSDVAKAFLNDMVLRYKKDQLENPDNTNNTVVESDSSAMMSELQELIGLQQVKKEVMAMKNFIEVNRRREQAGMKTPQVSYHCVFTGNPGTGKTTVARIVAGIYKELGILQKGHLVETDRSGLVAEYVGQTAVKTNKVIDSALDGVLFIDEAYSLVGAGNEDFGKEAIATLVKRMEDNRDRLVVILAGYEDEMQQFIESNPGLRSRFNRYIHFEDYSADELKQIYMGMLTKYDFALQEDGKRVLTRHLEMCVVNKGKDFGNARYVRNLFERTIKAQAVRLAAQPETDKSQLAIITADDISIAISDNP